ncbi:unnamed protein product [Penicillium salamii]|uniref:Uncharacterized protein n=1 Tax=Penicillium salamii TaxID=1612424 RepID=A0A9W4J9I4_9EURO|nr:unnamed protein product [Penicillium salamii]CAG8134471.1 unnamed protein product [Penicillium salamii]CAG8154900.1 unnamed protein product [Penicillium salamii]CAG8375334.1 unnamed protein product [Penicillium salamii]CAG8380164.1 unnamed protein product [Penicillium salamii]
MDALDYRNLRNYAIGAIIGILGFSYFVIYLLMFLVFHFPSSQESIPYALAVIAFGGGIAVWYLSVVFQNVFNAFHKEEAIKEQDSMWFVGLFLVWTAALPTIAFLFPAQPLLRLGYASAFTVIAVGSLSDAYLKEMNTRTFPGRLPLQLSSVGLLALVPTIHALAEPLHAPSPLATAFGRLVLINLFGCALYALRPLERIGIARSWQPSLHSMYLVLTYSLVEYSKAVVQVAIPYMS